MEIVWFKNGDVIPYPDDRQIVYYVLSGMGALTYVFLHSYFTAGINFRNRELIYSSLFP